MFRPYDIFRRPMPKVGWLIAGLIGGALLSTVLATWVLASADPLSATLARALLLVGLPGAVGGILYSTSTGRVQLPGRCDDTGFTPGVLADVLFGLVGGFAIFLVVPSEFKESELWQFIKITALAAIGGFGGRPIIENFLNQVLVRKIQDVTDRQERVEQEAANREAALSLVARQLDLSSDTPPVPDDTLIEAITRAPEETKVQIFYRARQARGESYRDPNKRELAARVVPILKALIVADKQQKYHRNYGQLGYALKDRPQADYDAARVALTQAIEIRDRAQAVGYKRYEFNRAICNITLDPAFHADTPSDPQHKREILADLRQAATEPELSAIIQREWDLSEKPPYIRWMRINGVTLEQLRSVEDNAVQEQ